MIHHHFIDWSEPALPGAADLLLGTHGRDGSADLQDTVVAVPGTRAGRRLKELLVAGAARDGLRLVPPTIVTVGDLPEALFLSRSRRADPGLRRLTWTAALRDAPANEVRRLFAELPARDDLAAWTRLGQEVARLHRSVARGGHDFASVAAACRRGFSRGALLWDDTARWSALSKLESAYVRALAAESRVDPDLDRIRAIETGDVAVVGEVWLVSIPEMAGVVRDALRKLDGVHVHVLIHAAESEAHRFDDLGCVRPDQWEHAELPISSDQIRLRDRPTHQADAVAEVLEGLGGARSADEIVIGVPDPGIVPWIEERLGESGIVVRNAAGTPIERTAPYRLLASVAEVLSTRRWEAFAALARHPDLGEWMVRYAPAPLGAGWPEGDAPPESDDPLPAPGGWIPAMDTWYEEYLPATVPASGVTLPGNEMFPTVAQFVEVVDGALLGGGEAADVAALADERNRPISAWARPIVALLARVHGVSALSASRPKDRERIRALEILSDAAHAFEALPASLDLSCSAAAAIRLVLEQARGGTVPEAVDEAAVEMLGWLELPLDDAAVVVVTGVNEPVLPESVTGDPFLPDALRVELQLVDNRRRYARDAYRLAAMAHTAAGSPDRTLVLVSGRRSASDDPVRPSRLLFATAPDEIARRVLAFYAPEGAEAARAHGDEPESASEPEPGPPWRSGFALPPESAITVTPGEKTTGSLSVTAFRALLANPYVFALERFRSCRTVDDHGREMDALGFGSLAHDVVEVLGKPEFRAETDLGVVTEALEVRLDRITAGRFGPGAEWAHVAVRLQIEQLRARIRRFAEWHVRWIGEGWRIHATEVSARGVHLLVDGEQTRISARIDRIDHHPETGRWAVFDYKSSGKPTTPEQAHRRRDGMWLDLQLPLYRWMLPHLQDEHGARLFPEAEGAKVEVGYILLCRELDHVGGVLAEWTEDDHAEAMEAAYAVVRHLREGHYDFDPDVRLRFADPELEALLGRGRLVGVDRESEFDGAGFGGDA